MPDVKPSKVDGVSGAVEVIFPQREKQWQTDEQALTGTTSSIRYARALPEDNGAGAIYRPGQHKKARWVLGAFPDRAHYSPCGR